MDIIEKEWDETAHPRVPAGTATGGQFSGGGKGPSAAPSHDDAGPGKPPADSAAHSWSQVPKDQQEMVRRNWAEDYMHRNINRPDVKDMDTAAQRDHLYREGKDMFDNRLPDEKKFEHFRRMDDDEFRGADQPRSDEKPSGEEKPLAPGLPSSQLGQEPREGHPEGGKTPEPEQEAFNTSAEPAQGEDEGPTPTPQEWGELNGRQQEKVFEQWKQETHDDFVRDNIDQWRDDSSNFEQIPREVSEDTQFQYEALKDVNDGFYPGERVPGIDDSGGGTPDQHAEEDRRVKEWQDHFDLDASWHNNAFEHDDEGNLTVDPDKLVFKDNPHEGPDAERQQLIPGVSREEMSSAYKKAEWAKVKDTFENEFKGKFEEEVEKRTDHLKENPPDYLYDVGEYQDEAWDAMDDREKWNHAQDMLSELKGGGDDSSGGSRGEGREGTIGPSKEDAPEQKAIQKKEPVSKKNLGGGVSESKIVTMKDGSKFVWKPSTGEAQVRDGIEAGTQYQREVAAYDIAKVVGMKNLMPVSSIMKYEGKYGVMMQMIPHAHNDGSEGDADFEDTAKRGTIFDFVIGNTDRHGANWMSDDNGKLWLIDHGLSFSTGGDSVRFGLWNSAVHNTNNDSVITDAFTKPWKGKWDKIETILERRHIESDAIEAAKKRYDFAMKKGTTWQHLFDYEDNP